MRVVRLISELNLDNTKSIALVPTMGAFHEGHLTLFRKARALSEIVAVSLFVNPAQFGPSEDFTKYPRDEQRDLDLAKACGVDLVFSPSVEEMYGDDLTRIHVAGVSAPWEGELRPGHFDGVATVVAKLFNIFRPQVAIFGRKDLQQCAVIRQFVKDLNFPVQLDFVATVREPDGLAMSSRNAYLSKELRSIAPELYHQMTKAAAAIKLGAEPFEILKSAGRELEELDFQVQYLEIVDAVTMRRNHALSQDSRLIAAVKLGETRLIDNVSIY